MERRFFALGAVFALIGSELMIGAVIALMGRMFFLALQTLATAVAMAIGLSTMPGVPVDVVGVPGPQARVRGCVQN